MSRAERGEKGEMSIPVLLQLRSVNCGRVVKGPFLPRWELGLVEQCFGHGGGLRSGAGRASRRGGQKLSLRPEH